MSSASGIRFLFEGTTLFCHTDSAEAADMAWQERQRWLRIWPADRLVLSWESAEGAAQVECTRLLP